MRVHFIIHQDYEEAAACEEWAISRDYQISHSRVYLGDKLPESAAGFDMLIIMGGPQSPVTTIEECPYFDTKAEQSLILSAINNGKAVLGICLGAQLIGQALNGMYEHSPNKEIGYFPIYLTEAGMADELISHFDKEMLVAHWHGDMPGLTEQAQVLAYSKGCPRQIIRYAPLVYGFQCHLELNAKAIDKLIAASASELEKAADYPYIQSAEEIRYFDYSVMNQQLFIFMDKLMRLYQNNIE